MEIGASRHLDHPTSEMWALLSNPDAHVATYAHMGHRDIEVRRAEVGDDVVEITIVRRVDVAVPAIARRFVQPANTVTSADRWERHADGSITGRSDLTIAGLPVRAVGRAEIVGEDGGCHYRIDLEMTTSVPVVGHRVAGAMRGQLQRQLEAQLDAAEAVLADG